MGCTWLRIATTLGQPKLTTWLRVTGNPWSSCLHLQSKWDCRHVPPCLATILMFPLQTIWNCFNSSKLQYQRRSRELVGCWGRQNSVNILKPRIYCYAWIFSYYFTSRGGLNHTKQSLLKFKSQAGANFWTQTHLTPDDIRNYPVYAFIQR